MLISVDSGNPEEIEQVMQWGFEVDKVTSNPTTISKTIRDSKNRILSVYDVVIAIRNIVGSKVPISVETIGTPSYNQGDMNQAIFVEEALIIKEWDPYFVVKLPTVPQGLEAARILKGEVPVNFTLIFSRHQGRLAAVYGGTYASPFVGRIDDKLGAEAQREGMDLVKEMVEDYGRESFATMVLTASTRKERGTYHLEKAAEYGSHVVTIPFNLFEHIHETQKDRGVYFVNGLRKHKPRMPLQPVKPTYDEEFDWNSMQPFERELTEAGVRRFLEDAKSANYSIAAL